MDIITIDLNIFRLIFKLDTMDLKWQLRRNRTKRIDYARQPLRSDDRKRFGSLRIAHREQKARQSADMIRMKMRHAKDIDWFKTKPGLLDGDLGSLSAIDQQTASIVTQHQ